MMQVTWIASYPKSGNTWVRFLLGAYSHGPLNRWFDADRIVPEFMYLYHQARRPQDLEAVWERLVREHRQPQWKQLFSDRMILKTHLAYSPAHPFLEQTASAILLVRHPADVLRSGINHHRLMGTPNADMDPVLYARGFLERGGDPTWESNGYGTWRTHYRSWLEAPNLSVLLVRYEDLKRSPHTELRRILEFLGLSPDAARIDEAVAQASFAHMRELERKSREKNEFFHKNNQYFFINRGNSDHSLDDLEPGLDEMLQKRLEEDLRRLGYASLSADVDT